MSSNSLPYKTKKGNSMDTCDNMHILLLCRKNSSFVDTFLLQLNCDRVKLFLYSKESTVTSSVKLKPDPKNDLNANIIWPMICVALL